MADTLALIDAALTHLGAALPELAVELFPGKPGEYRLNHPLGALLLGYASSTHGPARPLGMVVQERTLRLTVTLVTRQLWGRDGAVAYLDRLRAALVGWAAPDALGGMTAAGERFLSAEAGLWWYASEFETTTLTIEERAPDTGPTLTHLTLLDPFTTRCEIVSADGAITEEHFDP